MTQNTQSNILYFYSMFQNNNKNLHPSYRMNLDIWRCFGIRKIFRVVLREKHGLYYNKYGIVIHGLKLIVELCMVTRKIVN